MRAGRFTICLFAFAAMITFVGCESCRETFLPPPPQGSPEPAYEIGLVPADLRQSLHWPARPRTSERIEITSPPNGPWTRSGVRIVVRGQLAEFVIDADDVNVEAQQGAYVGTLVVRPGHRRIRIEGGDYGQLVLEPPTRLLEPPPEWRAEDMIEDVLIENVRVDAINNGLSGVLLRGRRIALLNSRVDAQFHAVLAGDTAPIVAEDIVIAGCSLWSAGEESTVTMRDVRRAVIVDSWIENARVFGMTIHGDTEWVVARSNTLVDGGAAFGTEDRDEIEHPWFWLNTMHHSVGELFTFEPDRIDDLVLAHNTIYSGSATCAWCGPTPESWLVDHNAIRRYEVPPARP